jgi:hypothetical protein
MLDSSPWQSEPGLRAGLRFGAIGAQSGNIPDDAIKKAKTPARIARRRTAIEANWLRL